MSALHWIGGNAHDYSIDLDRYEGMAGALQADQIVENARMGQGIVEPSSLEAYPRIFDFLAHVGVAPRAS